MRGCPSSGSPGGRRRRRIPGCSARWAARSSAVHRNRAGPACRGADAGCSPGRPPRWPDAIGRSPAARSTAPHSRCRTVRLPAGCRRPVPRRPGRPPRGSTDRPRLAELVDVDGVRCDVVVIDPPVVEHLADQAVHQRPGSSPAGPARCTSDRRATSVSRGSTQTNGGRGGTGQPIQDSGPQHRLGLGHVVSEQEHGVALVDVGVATWLPVGTEAFLHRRRRGRRAQPGIAVHVRGADPRLAEHGQGVVLLQEQLSRWCRTHGTTGRAHRAGRGCGPRSPTSRCPNPSPPVPRPGGSTAGSTGPGRSSPASCRTAPSARPPMIDDVDRPAADTDHPAVLDGDVARTSVAAQHTRRLHPSIHLIRSVTPSASTWSTRVRPRSHPDRTASAAPDM